MRRTVICIVVCALFLCGQAHAEEITLPAELEREVPQAAQLISGDTEDGFGFAKGASVLLKRAVSDAKQYMFAGVRALASVLVGVVLLGMMESISGDGVVSRRTDLIGALYIASISAGDINALIGLGRDTIASVSALSKVLIPSLAAATAAAGGVTAASVRQVTTVFFTDVLLTVIDRLLIPMLYVFIACAVASAVVDNGVIEGIASLIKKVTGWGLGILLSAYTAYLSISGAIAGAVDAQAVRVAKTAVSAAVPVVG
ncbi:MAG: hypothetical protein IKM11_05475, partial [Oscillospiraceae bacterium]|nr:hypothetical protein [Oscillospiraceae bacterium]